MRRLPTILCLTLSVLSSGCSSSWRPAFLPAPEIRIEKVTVPADLLACEAEPESLAATPWPTLADFGVWVELVRVAGADCRSKLDAIRNLQGGP